MHNQQAYNFYYQQLYKLYWRFACLKYYQKLLQVVSLDKNNIYNKDNRLVQTITPTSTITNTYDAAGVIPHFKLSSKKIYKDTHRII